MKTYEKLSEALDQLRKCHFVDDIGHPLEMNIAFVQLEELANKYNPQIAVLDKKESKLMRLHQLVYESSLLAKRRTGINTFYLNTTKEIEKRQAELARLQKLVTEQDLSLDRIQIAESLLYCRGSVTNSVDNRVLTEAAAMDIANDCKILKSQFLGNKRYEGFYQACDCSYGMGPRHGGICDEIGLKSDARKRDLTDEEKDACIYYLKNYSKIKSSQPA